MDRPSPDNVSPQRWRPRFGLATVFVAVSLTCAVLAALGGLIRAATTPDSEPQIVFLALIISLPLVGLVLLATAHSLKAALKPRSPSDDDLGD